MTHFFKVMSDLKLSFVQGTVPCKFCPVQVLSSASPAFLPAAKRLGLMLVWVFGVVQTFTCLSILNILAKIGGFAAIFAHFGSHPNGARIRDHALDFAYK